MRVCYFGIYDPSYNRNRVLISGLKANGHQVVECNSGLKGFLKYFDLIKKHWSIKDQYDVMVVGFPGQSAMLLAKLLSRKKIIFDAFLSFYDSMVFDRQLYSPRSLRGRYYWLLDWLSLLLADKILLDTETHIDYFVKTFNINRDKFHRIFVGADNQMILSKRGSDDGNFLVHFHGHFIPLQGIEYIIGAAKILEKEKIQFNIIGSGQESKRIKTLVKELAISNVNFVADVSYDKLREYLSVADVCLGIFGDTPKAKRVIPNKVYEAIASAKPVITMDSQAACELFTDGQDIIFVAGEKSRELADKILMLWHDRPLREMIANNAYQLYLSKLTPRILGAQLIEIINN